MDAEHFDLLARSLSAAPSRRHFLGGIVAIPGFISLMGASTMEAKKKKKRKPKLKRNDFGCVDVGQACRGNSANCCSGQCEGPVPKKGKKDTSTCIPHNVEECQAGDDACVDTKVSCGLDGICLRTTGNASFCGNKPSCADCTTDADCEEGFGPGAACVVCAEPCQNVGGTACSAASGPS